MVLSMRTKQRLLLLDSGAVIATMQLGLWSALVERFGVLVPATVVKTEVQFYRNEAGVRVEIDLQAFVDNGTVTEVSVSVAQMEDMLRKFDVVIRSGLDPGETEALTYLDLNRSKEIFFATGDGPAWKVLAML